MDDKLDVVDLNLRIYIDYDIMLAIETSRRENKMSDKNRERKCNKENYKKKQKRKRILKQKRHAQAISRETRKYVRKKIEPYYNNFRQFKDKHLLFVLKDTDNMERILLQKNDIGKGLTLLTLPVINEDMINQYVSNVPREESTQVSLTNASNEALNGLINYYYSVSSDEITDNTQANMMIFRNCRLLGSQDNLVPLNVRPYDLNTWYNSETTTINGVKVYKGNKLKTFFKIDENLGKTYIFHDTIMEILLYKAMMGKIRYQDLLSDHQMLAKRGNLFSGLYAIMATNEDEIQQRFKREQQEDNELEGR